VQGVSLRVTRLDSQGNLLNGPTDSYLTTAFIRVSFTPEYEDGDEITEKAADGTVCVSYKAPDTLKRVNMEIAICDPDPELTALMSGGLLLSGQNPGGTGEITKGWASAQVGEDPSGNGVAVEVWSRAIQNGKPAASDPFWHWVFPFVKTRLSGDRVVENGLLATSFEGYGLGNINFRNGPDGGWKWPAAVDRPYLYARTNSAPQGMTGFFTYPSIPTAAGSDPVAPTPTPPTFTNVPGTNVPNAGSPYSYRSSQADDNVLSEVDYKPDNTGSLIFEADADNQDVRNVPPASALQNPVTYVNRGYPAMPTGISGTPTAGQFTFTYLSGLAAAAAPAGTQTAVPADLAALRALGALGLSTKMGAGEYVTLKDGSKAYFNGNTWLAGVAPADPTGVDTTSHHFTFPRSGAAGTAPHHTPQTLADLQKLKALGQTTAWTAGQYVDLGDGSKAHWDGGAWVAGPAT
jgi:hypothetical protein